MASLEYILSLKLIQRNIYRYGGPIFLSLAMISALLGLFVFIQKSLRKNPCLIYFTAYNIAILLLIWGSFFPITLELGYCITPAAFNPALYRLRLYTTFLFNCICSFYLLLASIDRVLATSPSARIRQRSTQRLAYLSIGIDTICWIIDLCHLLIFARIIQFSFGFILAIQLMYEQVEFNQIHSLERIQLNSLIKSVAMFTSHLPFCVTSYVNLLVSKTFGKEVKDLLFWKRPLYDHQRHQISTS